MSADQVTSLPEPEEKRAGKWAGQLQQMLALASLVIIILVFTLLSPNFMTMSNVTTILTAATVTGILSLGTTFVIITGGIDLSLGTAMFFTGVMAGVFMTYWGLPMWLGIILTLLTGMLIGFINGFNVAVLGLPPFIATMGMMMITMGLSLVVSGAKPIYFPDTPNFKYLMNYPIIPGTRIPLGAVIFIFMMFFSWFVLSKTKLGKYDFAIGSNEQATALSGVNVVKWKVIIYTFSGLFVGLAGLLQSSRLESAQPAGGMGIELQAIAAVVIGGTSLTGGRGSITGTVIGAFIMAVLTNGLRIISVPQEWQNVAVGIVILLAVFVDQARKTND